MGFHVEKHMRTAYVALGVVCNEETVSQRIGSLSLPTHSITLCLTNTSPEIKYDTAGRLWTHFHRGKTTLNALELKLLSGSLIAPPPGTPSEGGEAVPTSGLYGGVAKYASQMDSFAKALGNCQ